MDGGFGKCTSRSRDGKQQVSMCQDLYFHSCVSCFILFSSVCCGFYFLFVHLPCSTCWPVDLNSATAFHRCLFFNLRVQTFSCSLFHCLLCLIIFCVFLSVPCLLVVDSFFFSEFRPSLFWSKEFCGLETLPESFALRSDYIIYKIR